VAGARRPASCVAGAFAPSAFAQIGRRFPSEKKIVPDGKRAFFMGNALVIGLIERVGKVIALDILH
jgi:hypothetical protein